ncbi:hypothetical protein ACT436_04525 [Acinetobacter baumannii]
MDEEILRLYGFGSFFNFKTTTADIDFLVIHADITKSSCEKAIVLKNNILKLVCNAEVTMLSNKEECEINFILKSKAILLGLINSSNIEKELHFLFESLGM